MKSFAPFTLCLVLCLAWSCGKTEEPSGDKKSEPAKTEPTGDAGPAADAAAADADADAAEGDADADAADAAAAATDAGAAPDAAGDAAATTDGGETAEAGDGPPKSDANDGPPKNLKVLPKKWSRAKVEDYMRSQLNRGLGVKCKFCHNTRDFASDENKHKEMARKMMRMTSGLNRQYFKGKEEITCFTCHKGKKEP